VAKMFKSFGTQCCNAASTVLDVAKPLRSFDSFGPIHPAKGHTPEGLLSSATHLLDSKIS